MNKSNKITIILINILILSLLIIWILPSLGLLITSFRTTAATSQTGWWTVFKNPFDLKQYTLDNYVGVLTKRGMVRAFFNSLLITIPSVFLPLLIATLASYSIVWLNLPKSKLILSIFVGLLVVPTQMAFIPAIEIFDFFGINGTYLAVWLAHTAFALPLMVYLFYNFMSEIPRSLIESATIDGASSWQVFSNMIIPLSLSAIASLFIFQFIWVWNNLLIALIFLGGGMKVAPLTVRIASLVGVRGEGWEMLTSAAFISMILPLIVFFSLQKYFVKGMLAGSVKG